MKYLVEVKETRVHRMEIEADSPEEAWEIAEETFPEGSISDQFDALELHGVSEIKP